MMKQISRRRVLTGLLAGGFTGLFSPRRAFSQNTGLNTEAVAQLRQRLGPKLIEPRLPWADLGADSAVPNILKNPWALAGQAGGTQSTGMAGAWRAQACGYAVRATQAEDVATAVDVARKHQLRLVVKGMGGDYYGRSSGPSDALLVWTRGLDEITVHDNFRAHGAPASVPDVRAITVSAGNAWLHAYQAATQADLYVQGGGCTTVGACGGFTQGGGFGSYSKRFGSGAAGVLQLEVVTADGKLRTVNAYQEPDLFWALRGGGGGTFGIVIRQTLLAHPIPHLDGSISGFIEARDEAALEDLVDAYLALVYESMLTPDWGEGVFIEPGSRRLQMMVSFVDMESAEAEAVWRPLLSYLGSRPDAFDVQVRFRSVPFVQKWQPAEDAVSWDRRPDAPGGQYWWKGNQIEVGAYWGGYQGRGIPLVRLAGQERRSLARAFVQASRTSFLLFQTNKGLAGISPEAGKRQRTTSMHPAVLDDAGYVTLANWVQYRYPGIAGHEPDEVLAKAQRQDVDVAMAAIRAVTPGGTSYVNEGNFFEPDWKKEFWGPNYSRLLAVKQHYDPGNLFRVHHGVGSDL